MTQRKTYAQIENELLQRYPNGAAPGGIQIEDLIQLKIRATQASKLLFKSGSIQRSFQGFLDCCA